MSGGGFNWNGGDIGSGTAQSNLQLLNVTANIAGPALNLGDNLNVNTGTTVSLLMSGRTLTFNLGAGINIASGGTFKWTPPMARSRGTVAKSLTMAVPSCCHPAAPARGGAAILCRCRLCSARP